MATATTTPAKPRVSLFEVIVLLLVIVCGAAVLLPLLPASRESARSNLCRYNLRQLDIATREYLENHRRIPDATTWPVELLPELSDTSANGRLKLGLAIFSMPRPRLLTCPSHPNSLELDPAKQTLLYTLVIDRSQNVPLEETKWGFRDRVREPKKEETQPWYLGVELNPEQALAQSSEAAGPHEGRYLESLGDGSTRFAPGPRASRPLVKE